MKRFFTLLIVMFCAMYVMAQELTVKSFVLDQNDLTASTQERKDANGDACALVKVLLATPGATFQGNTVGDVVYNVNQYWVYITSGSKRLLINHPNYLALNVNFSDYGITSVDGKHTYILALTLPQVNVVEKQKLTIKVTPQDAIVLVDGDIIPLSKGQTVISLLVGSHSYNVVKEGYIKQMGEIKLLADAPGKLLVELDESNVSTVGYPVNDDMTFTVNGVSFEMVKVGAGAFTMGATPEMKEPFDAELPTHKVTLTNNYYIGRTEVTQALWKAVMGKNPSKNEGVNKPVETVSWNDCQKFIKKLNSLTGKKFRLPTEAEWEFAARGGNKSKHYQYSGNDNLDDVAWCSDNSDLSTHDVATKQPNELGIYDMSGNVWEWCQDMYGVYSSSEQTNPTGPKSGSQYMYRGGGKNVDAWFCRLSNRGCFPPDITSYDLGFRLALSE